MLDRLASRDEWQFMRVLPKADPFLAALWWTLLIMRGLLPALFAVAMGFLTGAVQRGDDLTAPLSLVGVVFVLLQVLSPLHQAVGTNLGSQPTFAAVNEELATFAAAGGRPDNLIDRLLAGTSNTRAIAKGVCAATLGNAATLVQ